MNKTIRTDRLYVLAEHLRKPETFSGTHEFDYTCYASQERDHNENVCGTTACACGELPVIWPDEWELKVISPLVVNPLLKGRDHSNPMQGAIEWFNLWDKEMFEHLFLPECQIIGRYGWNPKFIPNDSIEGTDLTCYLSEEASAIAVAMTIEQFCAWADDEGLTYKEH